MNNTERVSLAERSVPPICTPLVQFSGKGTDMSLKSVALLEGALNGLGQAVSFLINPRVRPDEIQTASQQISEAMSEIRTVLSQLKSLNPAASEELRHAAAKEAASILTGPTFKKERKKRRDAGQRRGSYKKRKLDRLAQADKKKSKS